MPAAEGRTPECREGLEPRATELRSPPTEPNGVLRLPARVDATVAAALYRDWAPRAATLVAIDFAQVTAIDSAGVALVRALAAQAQRAGASSPRLESVTARYTELCLAHRLEAEGH